MSSTNQIVETKPYNLREVVYFTMRNGIRDIGQIVRKNENGTFDIACPGRPRHIIGVKISNICRELPDFRLPKTIDDVKRGSAVQVNCDGLRWEIGIVRQVNVETGDVKVIFFRPGDRKFAYVKIRKDQILLEKY